MREISEISLQVSDELEKLNDVCLLKPLSVSAKEHIFSSKICQKQKKEFWPSRLYKTIRRLFAPKDLLSREMLFKISLAKLLESTLWQNSEKKERLIQQALQLASEQGLLIDRDLLFSFPNGELFEKNPKKLLSLYRLFDIEAILDQQSLFLDACERLPILSLLEIAHEGGAELCELKTLYKKYKVFAIDRQGKVLYQHAKNQETSCVLTKQTIFPDLRGVCGQKLILDIHSGRLLGSYSGRLDTPYHVLEQILCLLNIQDEPVYIKPPSPTSNPLTLIFTSLYGLHEIDLILAQRRAIETYNGHTLGINGKEFTLNLIYINIPMDSLSYLPSPPEAEAIVEDMNDEAYLKLSYLVLSRIGMDTCDIQNLLLRLQSSPEDFFDKETQRLAILDKFKRYKPTLLEKLNLQKEGPCCYLWALLCKKKLDDRALKGIDTLIYLDYLIEALDIFHHKNCAEALLFCSAAQAITKSQLALSKWTNKPFIPGRSSPDEEKLFSALYSLYLLWEEPDIHLRFHRPQIGSIDLWAKKNGEVAKYLKPL